MSSFLTDKSMQAEGRFGGWALLKVRPFAEPGTQPHYTPDRNVNIHEIALELDVDPVAKTLKGIAHLSVSRPVGATGRIRLHLEELTVDKVEGPDGLLAWSHNDGILAVEPAAQLRVHYHGSPRKGLYWVGPTAAEPDRIPEAWTQCQDEDARYIFPCFDHPSVKHAFKLSVRVPDGYGVVSNGRLTSYDGHQWHWVQPEPMPAYLFTLVVMKMDAYEDHWDGIPLRYVVPAGTDADTVRRVFKKTPEMVAFLSNLVGRYPWPRYDQVVVHDFIFGGMENIAATTLIDICLTDTRAALDWDAEDLIEHELAHQWFGDLLTCQDWSQGWLNEGWATYSEHLWYTHDRGQAEGDWHLWEHLGNYLSEDGGRYRRPIVSYQFKAPIDMFDRHLYEKGALILHSLRHYLGNDVFWAGARHYVTTHRYGTVHTRDFQRAMEHVSGRNLDGFFHQFVYGTGHPCLDVSVAYEEGQLSVTVKQTQEGEGVAPIFRVPLRIGFGAHTHTLQLDGRERTYVLPCAEAPAFVAVDAGFCLLADITLKGSRALLVGALQNDPSVVGRVRAARALLKEGSPAAITALGRALREDAFWGVRATIAELLAENGGAQAIELLLGGISDTHPKVRRAVVASLGRVRRPEAMTALENMPVDASLQVEGERARALGRQRSGQARGVCEALLERESWMEVLRCRALEGLGLLRDASVLPTLLAWTAVSRPTRARAAAAAAMARLGDEVESVRKVVLERLCELAEDGEYRVQVASISALGVLKEAGAAGTLNRIHNSAGDGRCRRLAWEALQVIQEGRTTGEGLASFRKDLEDLRSESTRLRDSLSRVEQRLSR